MQDTLTEFNHLEGLSSREVLLRRKQFGENSFASPGQFRMMRIVKDIFLEPMFILLAIACILYFILGKTSEGIMMAVAVVIVTAISLFQEVKSTRALQNLQQFTEPKITVVRDGKNQVINIAELVPGDIILLEEGMKIPADACVIHSNDLSVNESVITGESLPTEKKEGEDGKDILYQGTTINSGKCFAKVTATGSKTELGKIGRTIETAHSPKTLLQIQVNKFVNKFALFGLAAFVIIFLVNYLHYGELATSLLFALTLAMSVIPEEIPVAFSSFMALGAYKMSKLGIISRQPQIIENLGAVSVICLDKTGTITENKMEVKTICSYDGNTINEISEATSLEDNNTLFFAALASESEPFDPMEKAILEAYHLYRKDPDLKNFTIAHEYPLEGHPPMMTHLYRNENSYIVAAKGSPERIISVCSLDNESILKINQQVGKLAGKGYRVLGVCSALHSNNDFPARQDDFYWKFSGLIALYDPPKKNIGNVLNKIKAAHIEVKMLTGDFPETAVNIAGQVGINGYLRYTTGSEVMQMDEVQLQETVKHTSVFARMFPDAKLKVINALKNNGEIVAMTGDGVNDGPALKSADIGIAMGKKGTETARLAADLILTDDNLERIVTAVSEGRKIFNNLVKALRYIISIHIPIILTASLPLLFGWKYPNIFTPVHIIFLELIMGPTCSIFFEREPVEETIMLLPPRQRTISLFSINELLISVVQGIIIAAGVLTLYFIFMQTHSIEETRSIVFTVLIISNFFLTFADRSLSKTILDTSRYKNNLAPVILIISSGFIALLYFVPAVRSIFQVAPISAGEFWLCFVVALISVMWFEVYKAGLRK
ncbi:MAG: cation-translocating P-type ATPase [Bacteroidota bacterium]